MYVTNENAMPEAFMSASSISIHCLFLEFKQNIHHVITSKTRIFICAFNSRICRTIATMHSFQTHVTYTYKGKDIPNLRNKNHRPILISIL